MRVLGLDVGNAKIKLCYLESGGVLTEDAVRWRSFLLPFSTDRRHDFEVGVPDRVELTARVFDFDPHALDAVVACSSHAYSFPFLHESVVHLASILTDCFDPTPVWVVAVDGTLTPANEIEGLDLEELSAHVLTNYYGSAWLGSRLIRNGIAVDIGTTSTDVIPIVEGRVDPVGLARPSEYVRFRYQNHRLAWYGVTWTPLVMVAPEIVTASATYQVVARGHRSDLVFALDDDLDPDLLSDHAYYPPPNREQALAGLCELVGLDRRLLPESEILAIREFLHERLVERVAGLMTTVVRESFRQPSRELDVAVFALGERVLARPALLHAGFDPARIRSLSFGRTQGLWSASSAFAMALLGLEHTLGQRAEFQ
jgi:uncharacterized hydantoinase/oxoprolinase family protein